MSIAKMMAEHPTAKPPESLTEAVRHVMYCAAICNACADACSGEEMDMRQCIRLCSDCADVCAALTRVATRQTGENGLVLQELLQLCVTACDVCAEECARHDRDHCRRCAEMCRECARDCRAALDAL
ncbi:four-helix bundle copper-binding protein [Allosphingosinicella indica]|uniref:Four-helix bundle copper-binding protein n=1 Tax=Allosphingosinicella indica TaxID=941907 RepID=A0A1X7GWJ6_9SPHN|nr:four-helix bundle copper-binding protein [Allosphingosinicella indica]SMF75551.1 protein of unknown function [Allosphingosinicella indica]